MKTPTKKDLERQLEHVRGTLRLLCALAADYKRSAERGRSDYCEGSDRGRAAAWDMAAACLAKDLGLASLVFDRDTAIERIVEAHRSPTALEYYRESYPLINFDVPLFSVLPEREAA